MSEKLENHDEIIEVFVDYKLGHRTLDTAAAELKRLAGFEEGVAKALLKPMKRMNVIDIRSYWLPGSERFHDHYRKKMGGNKPLDDK